jgi:beta-glucanase (GH16 family)
MRISRKNWFRIGRVALLLLVIAGTITTIKIISTRADASTIIPLNHGGTKISARTTNYSGNDGNVNPPSTAINWPKSDGFPTVHNAVGGTGTFANPITVAINSVNGSSNGTDPHGPYKIGEIFYVPRLHLYFVAEDSCNIDAAAFCSENDRDDGTQIHLDFFNGNTNNLQDKLLQCELSYGGNTEVIANPGDGYPMPEGYPQGTSLFTSGGQCVGADLWNKYSSWTIGSADSSSQDSNTPTPSPSVNENGTQTLDVDDSVEGSGKNQFNYSGSGWKHCQQCDEIHSGLFNESNSWDKTPGDSVTVTFTGTQIKFYGVTGPAHGIGTISLDNGDEQEVDFYGDARTGNTLLYTSPILDSGEHTLTIKVTGRKHDNATWNGINPDRVQILSGTASSSTATPPPGQSFVVDPGNTSDPTASDSSWKNVWDEDFTTGRVDKSSWTVQNYDSGAFNNEQQCYKDDGEHTRVENGHLVLEAEPQGGACPYISGRLDTQNKYLVQPPKSGKPVRVEASIQLPQNGNGVWPAFWMLGANISSVKWPNCGEIDILENAGLRRMSAGTVQATVHGLNDQTGYGIYNLPNGASFSGGYHIFAMDWYTDHISFSVDGHEYKSVETASLGGDQVFNQPYFIILNLAIGGNWPGNADSSTPFPQQMNVDFVRVYEHN